MIRIVHENNQDQRVEFWIDQKSGALVVKGHDETITIPEKEGNEILSKLWAMKKRYEDTRGPGTIEGFLFKWKLMLLRVNKRIEKAKEGL